MAAKIIFLNGPPSSGKDTLANHLVNTYENVVKTKFATPLKEAAHTLLGIDYPTIEPEYLLNTTYEDLYEYAKEETSPDFFNLTPRQFYIKLSEEFLKPIGGQGVFGYIWLRRNRAFLDNADLIIVSDCGFLHEIEPIIKHVQPIIPDDITHNKCVLLRLHRADCNYSNDSRNYINPPIPSADLNNIEGHPENMYSDFVKLISRWGMSDNLRLRKSPLAC